MANSDTPKLILAALGMVSSAGVVQAAEIVVSHTGKTARPNVILIMADDMGWGDVGFNGNTWIHTPNLDAMAADGIVLSRFYAASALSSPTRASVLTGRNPFRTGVFSANVGILRPEEVTIPEILHANGYTTGHFGKWHLGSLTCTKTDANRGRRGNTRDYNPPALHGYDAAFVTESKVPTWDPMRQPDERPDNKAWDCLKDGQSWTEYGTAYWDIDGNEVRDNLEGDDSRVIMDRVLPFISGAANAGKPFLAVVWFHTPHMPCVAGPEYAAMYPGLDVMGRNYGGCISAMDAQIGRLNAYLEEIGQAENTYIFFCSDNGPEIGSPGETGSYREQKRSLHEGGIRVPSLVYCPGRVKPSVCTELISTMDYLPTVVELTSSDISLATNQLDGQSFAPVLKGRKLTGERHISFMLGGQVARIDATSKLYYKNGRYELYDILSDPYESSDIAASNPSLVRALSEKAAVDVESCRRTFAGEEYGTESFNRMNQKWPDWLAPFSK